jgi:hypothetical protein
MGAHLVVRGRALQGLLVERERDNWLGERLEEAEEDLRHAVDAAGCVVEREPVELGHQALERVLCLAFPLHRHTGDVLYSSNERP